MDFVSFLRLWRGFWNLTIMKIVPVADKRLEDMETPILTLSRHCGTHVSAILPRHHPSPSDNDKYNASDEYDGNDEEDVDNPLTFL